MEWSNEKVLDFIQHLETEPILWNPRDVNHKKKHLVYDAWLRIKTNLSWCTTVEEMKKKKDSLMAYYRSHLNKIKKSLKSGAGTDDVYQTNWFAFTAMNSFLGPIYDCHETISTQIDEESQYQERVGEQNTTLSANEKDASPSRHIKSNSPTINKMKRTKVDLNSEIVEAKRQMREAFEHVKGSMNDESEMFGKLIASKLRKLKNPNTRDILMNDIHNMVFRACMIDRVTQLTVTNQSPSYQYSSSTSSPSQYEISPSPEGPRLTNSLYNPTCLSSLDLSLPQPSQSHTYQSPLGLSSPSESPQHQVYQSPLGQSSSPSPQHQAYQSPLGQPSSPSPQHHAFQSPLGQSSSPSPQHHAFQSPLGPPSSPSPQHHAFQSPLGPSSSPSPQHQAYQSPLGISSSPSPQYQGYKSPLGQSSSQSRQHQAYQSPVRQSSSQSLPDQSSSQPSQVQTFQSKPGQKQITQKPKHATQKAKQIIILETGEIKLI